MKTDPCEIHCPRGQCGLQHSNTETRPYSNHVPGLAAPIWRRVYQLVSAAILFFGVSVVIQMIEGPRLLYTRKEAARQLSISIRSLDYLIATKQLATRRVGKRVMIPHGEMIRFAKADHFGPITKAA